MTNRPTRCKVLGKPGTLILVDGTDCHVRLDGEGKRVDIWHVSQVEVLA